MSDGELFFNRDIKKSDFLSLVPNLLSFVPFVLALKGLINLALHHKNHSNTKNMKTQKRSSNPEPWTKVFRRIILVQACSFGKNLPLHK
jgi:hypothetical protein